MDIPYYLSEALTLNKQIKMKQAQIQNLRDLQSDIGQTLYLDKVQTTRNQDRLGDITASLIDLIDAYAHDVTYMLRVKHDIQTIVDKIKDPELRAVLECRYINCMKWEEIANILYVSERWLLKLHKKAVISFAESMQNSDSKEDAVQASCETTRLIKFRPTLRFLS